MPKIKVKITINNDENNTSIETNAIVQDNQLKYKEDENTMVTYDYEKDILLRENSDLRMNYSFCSGKGELLVKELNRKIPLEIKINKLVKEKNNVIIEFSIENTTFLYKVEEIL